MIRILAAAALIFHAAGSAADESAVRRLINSKLRRGSDSVAERFG
jgi:hypothetical protein